MLDPTNLTAQGRQDILFGHAHFVCKVYTIACQGLSLIKRSYAFGINVLSCGVFFSVC